MLYYNHLLRILHYIYDVHPRSLPDSYRPRVPYTHSDMSASHIEVPPNQLSIHTYPPHKLHANCSSRHTPSEPFSTPSRNAWNSPRRSNPTCTRTCCPHKHLCSSKSSDTFPPPCFENNHDCTIDPHKNTESPHKFRDPSLRFVRYVSVHNSLSERLT